MKIAKTCARVLLLSLVFMLVLSVPVLAADSSAAATAATTDINPGLAYLAAALAMGISAIGGGIAVGAGAPAAIGALTEDPKSFGKAMIFVALGEGIALYGMLIAILILAKV